ncbi:hypothetical protein HanRHA438_Chr10g0447081 [Helianthus annuus]|nr:hypothetical protein HanIR_Chr10g0468991 [Helianthus annuus]KAJ0696429.1 hypothetical protein HanLR1_Chr10g0356991 [Helianthus annuus]KAJ0879068.1 hypothetical protein HanRHA438_Chr10g0447081 [Helianthus annuus]
MASKDQDLVKHGTNLPNYLYQYEGKTGNTLEKMYNFGVLDWSRVENWKSNTKVITKTNNQPLENKSGKLSYDNLPRSDQQASKGSLLNSSLSRKFNSSLEKISKSFIFKTSSTYKHLKSGLITYKISKDLHSFNLKKENGSIVSSTVHKAEQNSSNVKALLKLTMKNGIPSFETVEGNSSNSLTAVVNKLPSGKDDTSLTYTFYSVHDIGKMNQVWKKQDLTEKDSASGYNIVGNMKICSSYHAEFSGLERDLFVVRESVLYGPDCSKVVELAAIIAKNTSKENFGGLGSSKSTVVILPGGNHSLPNSGQPSPLIDRWRSGGICDCGGWDIGCELTVLTNQNETTEVSNPSSSNRIDLCYQGRHNKEHAFRLAPLENGFYSLEYNASSMSFLQAFSICVAVISSQSLTHIFQVNRLQDANDFIKPLMTRHRKVKSQTFVHPPITSV